MAQWLFFPDYRGSLPYQDLLARALAEVSGGRVAARAGSITDALEAPADGPVVFHLHWEDAVCAGAADEAAAAARIDGFLAELAGFTASGGVVVWTMHNAAPHDDPWPAQSARLRAGIAAMATLVHVHGAIAAGIAARLGIAPGRLLVVPTPDLSAGYPDDITDPAARRYFDLAAEATVFAFIGAMRGYKGVDLLLRAFAAVHAADPGAQLVLGGRQPGATEGRYFRPAPGVRLIPRFVDDAVVQYVLRAADFVVLPYRRVPTSSGVASLALGFGRPLIVPDLPALHETVRPGREALFFRPDDDADLARVLRVACTLDGDARRAMRTAAALTGRAVRFPDLAAALLGRLPLPVPA